MCAFYRDAAGDLLADGLSLADIATAHGSPLYVYSGNGIRTAYSDFVAAVAPVNGKVHFAVKANSALGVIALLARHGAGADIVSGGELERALAAGIDPAHIVFSGVGKTKEEIARALSVGVGQINAESPAEIDMISHVAAAAVQRHLSRVGRHPEHLREHRHRGIRRSGRRSCGGHSDGCR